MVGGKLSGSGEKDVIKLNQFGDWGGRGSGNGYHRFSTDPVPGTA